MEPWRTMRKYRPRDFSANILASILLIGMGFVGCLALVLIFEPTDVRGYLVVLGVFGPLTLLPLSGLRRPASERRIYPFAFLRSLFRKKRRAHVPVTERKMWKRRKSSFVPEPWGQQRLERESSRSSE